jgi:hypothetical protein
VRILGKGDAAAPRDADPGSLGSEPALRQAAGYPSRGLSRNLADLSEILSVITASCAIYAAEVKRLGAARRRHKSRYEAACRYTGLLLSNQNAIKGITEWPISKLTIYEFRSGGTHPAGLSSL